MQGGGHLVRACCCHIADVTVSSSNLVNK
jgi:hypothetical protein